MRLTETRTLNGVRQFRLIGDENWLDFDAPTVRESRLMSAVQKLAELEDGEQSRAALKGGSA